MKTEILNQYKNLSDTERENLFRQINKDNFANASILLYALLIIHIPILFLDIQKYFKGMWVLNSGYEYIFRMHIILYGILFIFAIAFKFLKKYRPEGNLIFYYSYIFTVALQVWCAVFSAIEQKLFGDISVYAIALFGLPILYKFRGRLEFSKLTLTHIIFIYTVPIFQSMPDRTEGVFINSTVAVVLAFIASRLSFYSKIGEISFYSVLLKQKEELSSEKEKVKEATKSKNEFIANMSHEIQNQMNGVIGILKLLDSTKLNDEQKEYVTILNSCEKDLLTIISDILDFTQIEAGETELDHKLFELPNLINEIVSISSSLASINNNMVKASIAPNVPTYISGDRIRLSQILLNLLGNAVKFTKLGRIDLNVSVLEKHEFRTTLAFEVKDTGIGIPKERLDSIFEMYTKGEISSTREYKGTGLGLAISKRLVEMMHGVITVTSKEGKGTNFRFTIQTEDCDHLIEKKNDLPLNEAISKKLEKLTRKIPLNILLVDDNEINIKLGKKVFEKLGYNVKTAFDGREAVEICKNNSMDIVFMDLRMPILNGFEATEMINKTKTSPIDKPFIIALTANENNADREKCLQLGMVDFIKKPLIVSQIKEYVGHIIEKYYIKH